MKNNMTEDISTKSETMRYLLGKLAESEEIAIEETFFGNAQAFDDLLIAENELIDAFMMGRLSTEDGALFESRLLVSRRQHQRARFAKALITYSGQFSSDTIESYDSPLSNRFYLLNRILAPRLMWTGFTAVALLVLVSIGFWRMYPFKSPDMAAANSSTEQQTVAEPIPNIASPSNDQAGTPLTKAADPAISVRVKSRPRSSPIIATILLPFSSTRDLATGSSFTIPNDVTQVKLVAEVERDDRTIYFGRVETVDGKQIWHGIAKSGSAGSVVIIVPRDKLRSGDFILTIKKQDHDRTYQDAGQFSFTIKSPH
jgi:hypothetical protein